MSQEVTQLLVELGKNNDAVLDQLLPLVYAEPRRMARHYMAMQNPGHTLQPTALIHEAYVRLIAQDHRRRREHEDVALRRSRKVTQ